jgi:hypothetical protein
VGDRGSTREAHVARFLKFAPPMCSVRSRLGNGHALRPARLAARQLTAVTPPLQGPLASARSCVPLRVRSVTTGVISHLYRADPSSGHQAISEKMSAIEHARDAEAAPVFSGGRTASKDHECVVRPEGTGGLSQRAHKATGFSTRRCAQDDLRIGRPTRSARTSAT